MKLINLHLPLQSKSSLLILCNAIVLIGLVIKSLDANAISQPNWVTNLRARRSPDDFGTPAESSSSGSDDLATKLMNSDPGADIGQGSRKALYEIKPDKLSKKKKNKKSHTTTSASPSDFNEQSPDGNDTFNILHASTSPKNIKLRQQVKNDTFSLQCGQYLPPPLGIGRPTSVWEGKYPFLVNIGFFMDPDEIDYIASNDNTTNKSFMGAIMEKDKIYTVQECYDDMEKKVETSVIGFGNTVLSKGFEISAKRKWSIKAQEQKDDNANSTIIIIVKNKINNENLDLRLQGDKNVNSICAPKKEDSISIGDNFRYFVPYYDQVRETIQEAEVIVVMCPKNALSGICGMAHDLTGKGSKIDLPCGSPLIRENVKEKKWTLVGLRSRAYLKEDGLPIDLGANKFYFQPLMQTK